MSGWPMFATDRTAPAPQWWAVLAAGVIALLFPVVLGFVVYVVGFSLTLSLFGMFGIYSIAFSWAGVLPGIVIHLILLRMGYGGWLAAGIMALGLGLLLSLAFGPLAAMFSVPVALVYWIALNKLAPEAVRGNP